MRVPQCFFCVFPWGITQLQSDWSMSCDHGRTWLCELMWEHQQQQQSLVSLSHCCHSSDYYPLVLSLASGTAEWWYKWPFLLLFRGFLPLLFSFLARIYNILLCIRLFAYRPFFPFSPFTNLLELRRARAKISSLRLNFILLVFPRHSTSHCLRHTHGDDGAAAVVVGSTAVVVI